MTWAWATASNFERGEFVRSHFRLKKPLSFDQVCELFLLTTEGAEAIRYGADWNPDYEVKAGR